MLDFYNLNPSRRKARDSSNSLVARERRVNTILVYLYILIYTARCNPGNELYIYFNDMAFE